MKKIVTILAIATLSANAYANKDTFEFTGRSLELESQIENLVDYNFRPDNAHRQCNFYLEQAAYELDDFTMNLNSSKSDFTNMLFHFFSKQTGTELSIDEAIRDSLHQADMFMQYAKRSDCSKNEQVNELADRVEALKNDYLA